MNAIFQTPVLRHTLGSDYSICDTEGRAPIFDTGSGNLLTTLLFEVSQCPSWMTDVLPLQLEMEYEEMEEDPR